MTDDRPTLDVTYKRADGGDIYGEYAWVTDIDYFDEEEDPVEIIEETWVRTDVRRFWHLPHTLYSCTKVDDCDEDAVAWEQQADGTWAQVCPEHQTIG